MKIGEQTVKWGKSASQYTQEALDEISAHIGTHFVSFKISTHEDEFLSTVKIAIKSGDIIRTQITPDNLKQVFDKWVVMVGREILGIKEEDYALLFFADIMHDGTVSTHANLPAELLHKNGAPVFSLAGKMYELGNKEGYRQFWAIYHKPPKSEYRDYLLERRDSLIPLDERSFKGAYYTPLHVVDTEVLDKDAQAIGEKTFFNVPNNECLSEWFARPKTNKVDVVPLKNAVTPATATKDLRGTKWADGAIAYMLSGGNDLQHAEQQTVIFSSGYGSARGFFITAENLWQAAIVFAVRRAVRPTWLNDRDQFLQPTAPLTDEFKTDCLIWMLFNRCNRTAGANDLEWSGQTWSLVNHFIPFTEADVGAPDRFESDFMVQYLAGKILPVEAQAVLIAGRSLWQAYFAETDVRTVRDELKLNRADVGWFQVRTALATRNASGDTAPVNFVPFELAYQALTDKLRPQVFSLGFLR